MKTNKILSGLLMAAVAMAGLTACTADEPLVKPGQDQNGQQENGEGVYLGLTIKMPRGAGTRSSTIEPDPTNPGNSSDGTEVGTDAENRVTSVYVVLARKSDNGFIAGKLVNAGAMLTPQPATNSYRAISEISKTRLNNYYVSQGFDPQVHIFVFCNPTSELTSLLDSKNSPSDPNSFDTSWINATCEVIQSNTSDAGVAIWQEGKFLMNNYRIATRSLPARMADWDAYKTQNTAFDLSGVNGLGTDSEVDNSVSNGLVGNAPNVDMGGAVQVERSVARFDFKDGSPLGNNTYDVVKDKGGHVMVQVQLTNILLANEAQKFYYLPRVSSNGQLAGSTLCGLETPGNYVVGPYASDFAGNITTGFDSYFNYTFFDNEVPQNIKNNYDIPYYYDGLTWYNSKISSVLSEDNTSDNYQDKKYKVWRYCTENVIPASTENQQKGITTTVIFKAKMIATEACKEDGHADNYTAEMYKYLNNKDEDGKPVLSNNTYDNPTLYSFNGSLYFTWNNVVNAAIAASVKMDDKGNIETYEDANGVEKISYIDRTDPLYVAVFGGGGMGTFTYRYANAEGQIVNKSYTDDLPVENGGSDGEGAICANVEVQKYLANPGNGTLAKMRTACTKAGFTLYQTSNDPEGGLGYYCYYYYYNRHNDNGNNGVMGPMEFAVVRNNVYKLSVTDIKTLGHPRLPMNDPDAPKPDDPDESDDIYLTVTCQVIPWVVRVNDIVFQ